MKRALGMVVVIVGLVLTAGPVRATTSVIPWGGNGSENLPCSEGGHWVLAPSFGIDSATLHVDGNAYTMTENGNGSWSADSVGPIDANVDAYVTYTGDGDERDHLQLSHCTDSSPSPSPSGSPSPSPSPSESPSPSPSGSSSTPPGGHSSTSTVPPTLGSSSHCGATCPTPTPTAFTGLSRGASWAIFGALIFAALGIGALWIARARGERL